MELCDLNPESDPAIRELAAAKEDAQKKIAALDERVVMNASGKHTSSQQLDRAKLVQETKNLARDIRRRMREILTATTADETKFEEAYPFVDLAPAGIRHSVLQVYDDGPFQKLAAERKKLVDKVEAYRAEKGYGNRPDPFASLMTTSVMAASVRQPRAPSARNHNASTRSNASVGPRTTRSLSIQSSTAKSSRPSVVAFPQQHSQRSTTGNATGSVLPPDGISNATEDDCEEALRDATLQDMETEIGKVERDMNQRAKAVAKRHRKIRRKNDAEDQRLFEVFPYVVEDPFAVQLSELCLENDREFTENLRAAEGKELELQEVQRVAGVIDQIATTEEPSTEMTVVTASSSPAKKGGEYKIRELKQAISGYHQKMNARARELASDRRLADEAILKQYPFLPTSVNGIPIALLNLPASRDFHALFSNDGKQLRQLVNRLAKERALINDYHLAKDEEVTARFPFLPESILGEPLRDLNLLGNGEFTHNYLYRNKVLKQQKRKQEPVVAKNGAAAEGSASPLRRNHTDDPSSVASPFKAGFDAEEALSANIVAAAGSSQSLTSILTPQERQRREVEDVLRTIAFDQVASVAQQEEMDFQKGFPFVARRPLSEALRHINLSNDPQFVDAIKKERAAGDLRSAEQEKARNDARRDANVRAHELAREYVMARIRLGDLERDAQKDKFVASKIVLAAVARGYAVRKKLSRRRGERLTVQQKEDRMDFLASEQEDRRDIIGYEQAEARSLLEAHMAVQGLVREWRDRRRRATEEIKVLNGKLRQVQVDEERARVKIQTDATQYWAQLARTYRKLRNSSVRIAPLPPPGSIVQDEDDESNSTQTRRTNEFGANGDTQRQLQLNSSVVSNSDGMEGFPLDQTAVFITEYEAHLRDFRSRLVEDQRGLLDQYNKVMALRDKLSYDMSPTSSQNPPTSNLEPKRPTTVDGSVAGLIGGGRVAAGGQQFRSARFSSVASSSGGMASSANLPSTGNGQTRRGPLPPSPRRPTTEQRPRRRV